MRSVESCGGAREAAEKCLGPPHALTRGASHAPSSSFSISSVTTPSARISTTGDALRSSEEDPRAPHARSAADTKRPPRTTRDRFLDGHGRRHDSRNLSIASVG